MRRHFSISGALYLIRPELILVSIAVSLYVIISSGRAKELMPWLVGGFVPVLLYHGYMVATTGSLVPSGIMAAVVTFIQEPASWLDRFGATLQALWSAAGLIYLAGGVLDPGAGG